MMAKDVVRMRGQVNNFYKMRAQMQSASMQMQSMKSQQTMAKAMAGVTHSLQLLNGQMNMPAMQRMMMEYEKQSEMMEFKQEMMDDAMDDIFEADGEEEKTELMVNQILDEVGMASASGLGSVPTGGQAVKQAAAPVEEDDLQARLEMLRGAK